MHAHDFKYSIKELLIVYYNIGDGKIWLKDSTTSKYWPTSTWAPSISWAFSVGLPLQSCVIHPCQVKNKGKPFGTSRLASTLKPSLLPFYHPHSFSLFLILWAISPARVVTCKTNSNCLRKHRRAQRCSLWNHERPLLGKLIPLVKANFTPVKFSLLSIAQSRLPVR